MGGLIKRLQREARMQEMFIKSSAFALHNHQFCDTRMIRMTSEHPTPTVGLPGDGIYFPNKCRVLGPNAR